MGDILVARGKTTKEWNPGYEKQKEIRPREMFFQGKNLLSDGSLLHAGN
jgi:hypothetical protein